jgi:hypothetical protein
LAASSSQSRRHGLFYVIERANWRWRSILRFSEKKKLGLYVNNTEMFFYLREFCRYNYFFGAGERSCG